MKQEKYLRGSPCRGSKLGSDPKCGEKVEGGSRGAVARGEFCSITTRGAALGKVDLGRDQSLASEAA